MRSLDGKEHALSKKSKNLLTKLTVGSIIVNER